MSAPALRMGGGAQTGQKDEDGFRIQGKETLDLPILTVKSSHQRIAGRQLQKIDPPDVMTLVLAAVDDSWRDLQRTLSSLTAREMETPGVCGDWSIKDIIGHLTSREAMLLFEVATEKEAEIADTDELNRRQVEDKADTPVREIMAEFEQTHRSLKVALGNAPKSSFEYGSPMRRRIDESTVLHYQEHDVHIRSWLINRRRRTGAPPANPKV